MIQPTIGRVVWYRAGQLDGMLRIGEQPFIGHVAYVHTDRSVNLVIFDHYGNSFAREKVVLVQEGDDKPHDTGYAEWMPYQVGQAQKHAVDAKAGSKAEATATSTG